MAEPNSIKRHPFPTNLGQLADTPFYYYDIALLRETLRAINNETAGYPFQVHYALKANCNSKILNEIAKHGLGADLVSGGELIAASQAGFEAHRMNFSGVGKTDREIKLALEQGIGCFNVESIPELEVINHIAAGMGNQAPVAIRVNPDIDAHTHKYITTGTVDDKFGIPVEALPHVITRATSLPGIRLLGLHFHIGSQITDMEPYRMLCHTINKLIDSSEQQGTRFNIINVGGGLGIDYSSPDEHPIADFKSYFDIFKHNLRLREGQQLHFELGRAIVAQCGSLIARVTYVKENRHKKFIVLDAGMNDLIRPALYQARHAIQNLTAAGQEAAGWMSYDVVGPVCESSDTFGHDYRLPHTRRGDIIAIRSAGAYGESMASTYNMRPLPGSVTCGDE